MPQARRAVLFLVLSGFPFACSAETFRDDRGTALELRRPAQRIVALSPNLAELAYAAGAGSRLAAVVRFSDYPAEALTLPQVGDASRIDAERVLALQPDLVLAWQSGNPAGEVERLRRLGLPVFVTEARTLADIARLVRTIGRLAGTNDAAARAADAYERELDGLRQRYADARPVRVFYEIWQRPLLTVNRDHAISDVIALCGGRNVFHDARALTPALSIEALVAARPEVVLGGSSAATPDDFVASWRAMPVAALRELPVRYVPPDVIQRQTLRIAQGARVVCEHIKAVRKR